MRMRKFCSKQDRLVALNLEISVSAICKNVCTIVKLTSQVYTFLWISCLQNQALFTWFGCYFVVDFFPGHISAYVSAIFDRAVRRGDGVWVYSLFIFWTVAYSAANFTFWFISRRRTCENIIGKSLSLLIANRHVDVVKLLATLMISRSSPCSHAEMR